MVPTFYQFYRKNHHLSPLCLPYHPLPSFTPYYQKLSLKVQIPMPHSQLFRFGSTLKEVQKSAFLSHAPAILMPVF